MPLIQRRLTDSTYRTVNSFILFFYRRTLKLAFWTADVARQKYGRELFAHILASQLCPSLISIIFQPFIFVYAPDPACRWIHRLPR